MVIDLVNHPPHYSANRIGGLECIEVTRHFMFSAGNAIKYVWRAGYKLDDMQDLDKAVFYLNDVKDTEPVVGTTAKEVASYLDSLDNLDNREKLVVGVVTALADKMYNRASDNIVQLRNYIKESTNAGAHSNQD